MEKLFDAAPVDAYSEGVKCFSDGNGPEDADMFYTPLSLSWSEYAKGWLEASQGLVEGYETESLI